MTTQTHYTNEQVRKRLISFRANHFNPSYAELSREIGITYTYLVAFKNGKRDMGQEALERVAHFIEENEG